MICRYDFAARFVSQMIRGIGFDAGLRLAAAAASAAKRAEAAA